VRDLTHAEVLSSWRVDGELYGHTPSQTIQFVSALVDVADEQERQRALPAFLVPTGRGEPWWVPRLRSWLGR
jgi:hypothetical protein